MIDSNSLKFIYVIYFVFLISTKVESGFLNPFTIRPPDDQIILTNPSIPKRDTLEIPPEAYHNFLDKFTPQSLPFQLHRPDQMKFISPRNNHNPIFDRLAAFDDQDQEYFIPQFSDRDFHLQLGVNRPWQERPMYIFRKSSQSYSLVLSIFTGQYGNSKVSPYGATFRLMSFSPQGKLLSSIPFASALLHPILDEVGMIVDVEVAPASTGRIDQKFRIVCQDREKSGEESNTYYQLDEQGNINRIE